MQHPKLDFVVDIQNERTFVSGSNAYLDTILLSLVRYVSEATRLDLYIPVIEAPIIDTASNEDIIN